MNWNKSGQDKIFYIILPDGWLMNHKQSIIIFIKSENGVTFEPRKNEVYRLLMSKKIASVAT